MIKQNGSSTEKAELIERLGDLIMRWQEATQRHDEAVGEIFQLGPAERLCLSFLARGPQTASAIARATRLTPAAVTALVDRLEARNYVRRRPDPLDRRKVLVEAGAATQALIQEVYLPLAQAGAAAFDKRSAEELQILAEVMEQAIAIQDGMAERLLARPRRGKR